MGLTLLAYQVVGGTKLCNVYKGEFPAPAIETELWETGTSAPLQVKKFHILL
jgi:hypothetical protein